MVYFSRRATAKMSKFQEAIKWGKEIADYLNNKYGLNIGVYTQRWGDNPTNTMYWVGNLESMSKYLEFVENLNKDEGYLEKLSAADSFLVDGGTFDSLLIKQ